MRPFWQDLVLQLAGPVFAALVGTAVLGYVAQRIARRTQDAREIQKLRDEFVRDATSAAVGLYVATQRFWRATNAHANGDVTDGSLEKERAILDEQYRASRVEGEILECRFYAYFAEDTARRLMHRVMDLLTVRYFQLIGRDTPALLEINAGEAHSGLTVAELRNANAVLGAYRTTLLMTVESLVSDEVSIQGVQRDVDRAHRTPEKRMAAAGSG